jgi:hypothetical protein
VVVFPPVDPVCCSVDVRVFFPPSFAQRRNCCRRWLLVLTPLIHPNNIPALNWDLEHTRTLLHILNTVSLELHAQFSAVSMRARVIWFLLGLVTVSLVSMPVTQHLWTWDGFLHGGQDFETGAFLILISFCLVVVLARSCKSSFERMLTAWRALALLRAQEPGSASFALEFQFRRAELNNPLGAFYNPPLQI